MRILSLDLENVKSYVRQHVEFTTGLNAVCGLNGSGKTTVLEAIGFALFDFLPYNQAAFVREGTKMATIRVQLLARDGRGYEVVRRIGGGSAYYVADLESGTRLAERAASVLEWIRTQALGLDAAADLESLFKNAVGVPQGLITADFLQNSATTRKNIFDPLLRVEEYREAYENLRETAAYVKNLTSTIGTEIARLEAETEPISYLRERAGDLEAKIHGVEEQLARLAVEQNEVEASKRELDAAQERCREAEDRLRAARFDQTRFGDMLVERTRALSAAEEARSAAREAEPGYRAVVAARERLRALEADRRTRDELNAQSARVTARMSSVHGLIEGLRTQWEAALAAEREAADLLTASRRQDELDAALAQIAAQLGERDSLTRETSRVNQDLSTARSAVTATEKRLAEANQASREVQKVESVKKELEEVRSRLARMEPSKKQLQGILDEGQRLRHLYDEACAGVERRDEIERRLASRKPEASVLEGILARRQQLREELARAQATIEFQNVARTELLSHHCPLLDLTCPAVEADAGVLGRFDRQVTVMDANARRIETDLADLEPAVEAAQSATSEVRDLEIQTAQLLRWVNQRDTVRGDLERCRAQYAEIAELVKGESELLTRRDWLTAEETRLQRLSGLAALLPELEDRRAQEQKRVESLVEEEQGLMERHAMLRAVEERQRELEGSLLDLGDPRGRRSDLLAVGRRGPELATKLEQEQRRLDEENDHLKAIVGQLQRFQVLDDEIEEQQAMEARHAPEYDRYQRHRQEADRLDERRLAVDEVRVQHEEAAAQVLEEEAAHAAAERAYDADRHREVQDLHSELGKNVSARTEERKFLVKQRDETSTELARLQRQYEKLQQRRLEVDDLGRVANAVGFIRETLKLAGPAVTETLLANISQTANDIYEEIMDDHAADLRWSNQYEIVVQRGAEERKFAQLSGGEQMSAALAVRLALLKEMSEIDFAFFDEPTQNMDGERRGNLAQQIQAVRGFEQLIVISHDDTFEHHTDNLIRLRKEHEETRLEST